MLNEALGAWLGYGVAGANEDAIKDVLYPSRSLRVSARVACVIDGG